MSIDAAVSLDSWGPHTVPEVRKSVNMVRSELRITESAAEIDGRIEFGSQCSCFSGAHMCRYGRLMHLDSLWRSAVPNCGPPGVTAMFFAYCHQTGRSNGHAQHPIVAPAATRIV